MFAGAASCLLLSVSMSNALLLLLASLLSSFGGARGYDFASPLLDAELDAPRREITFYFENRKEALGIALFGDQSGRGVAPTALRALSHFVRCYRTDRERPIHPRLAEIVARVADAFGRDAVKVISGFRAPPYGAPHSKHFLGRAMDFHLPGVSSKKVAAWVWKNFRGVGVGTYPKQDFLHVDVREVDVRWVDTSLHGESAHARYYGRSRGEVLPKDAPRLAYDASKPMPQGTALAGLSATILPARARLVPFGISDGY